MSIVNDQVRRVRGEDGNPPPLPYDQPIIVDIVCWVPGLYVGTSMGALIFMAIFVNLLGNQTSECVEYMQGWGVFLLLMVIAGAILSCTASCMILFQAFQRRGQRAQNFEQWRIMMGRWNVRTRTVNKKPIFAVLIASDVLSILCVFFCYPLFYEAVEKSCDSGFSFFLLIVGSYVLFAPMRLLVILAHFVYGQRFWRWVKRHISCLNTVEYEQRVEFDIYKASEYVEKVNQNVRALR